MKLGFDPFISPLFILLVGSAYPLLILFIYRRWSRVISSRYLALLIGTQLLFFFALMLLIANPYIQLTKPDPQQVHLTFLIDASGSMTIQDCGQQSRIDVVKKQILSPEQPFYRTIIKKYPHSVFYLFSGKERFRLSQGDRNFDILPGDTDIDAVLNNSVRTDQGVDAKSPDAVILVTDGLDNAGVPLLDGIQSLRHRQIPIHCIGVGDNRIKKDLAIQWINPPGIVTKGEKFHIKTRISRNFTGDFKGIIRIYQNQRELEQREIHFKDDLLSYDVNIEHINFASGVQSYRAEIKPIPEEENQVNNISILPLQVKNPQDIQIFYYTENLGWNYKFLHRLVEKEKYLQLDALIRTGQNSYFMYGLDHDPKLTRRFPVSKILTRYHVILIDLSSLSSLTPEELEALNNFVENRGGGIVFMGVIEAIPKILQSLFPATISGHSMSVQLHRQPLEITSTLIFQPNQFQRFKALENHIFLPAGSPFYPIDPLALKPAAKSIFSLTGKPWSTLLIQPYALGKVAFLNCADTWKWALASDGGEQAYSLFWTQLFFWAASSSKKALRVTPTTGALTIGKEHIFHIDILRSDFLPDNNADPSISLIKPNGNSESISAVNNPNIYGRYEAHYIPDKPGLYRLNISATRSQGSPLTYSTEYLVIDSKAESQALPLAEQKLQRLTQMLGGEYWHYSQIDQIKDIPLKPSVIYHKENTYMLSSWLYFMILLLSIPQVWLFRRRIGLR